MPKLRSPVFFFIGIIEENTESILTDLEEKLITIFSMPPISADFTHKGELLILTLKDPGFRYYIVITTPGKFKDYEDLAKNFNLPWNKQITDLDKLKQIYKEIDKRNWFGFDAYQEIGFTILEKMTAVPFLKTYAIPSFSKANKIMNHFFRRYQAPNKLDCKSG
jgi:hypothetical protein